MPQFSMSRHHGRRCAAHIVLALSLVGLSACGPKSAAPSTQVAAKVGSDEVSVHQINFLLKRQGDIPAAQRAGAEKAVLEHLIDQELALQKAQALKLDREPEVMQALAAARRDIIARAYVDRVTSTVSRPTPDEIKQYFEGRPLLFSQRRLYDVQDVQVKATPEQLATIAPKLNSVQSVEEAAAIIRAAQLVSEARSTTLAPESVPEELIERIVKLPPGRPIALSAPGGVKLIFVTASRSAPVDLALASPRIENFLFGERKRKAIEQDLKSLRATTKIEYAGAFATAAAASAPAASAPAATDDSNVRGLK